MGFLSHNPPFYPELTGLENLDFWLDLHPAEYSSDYASEMLAKVGLIMFKDDMAGNYSRGMIQRLGFAISIAHSPTTLLLDEPFSALDVLTIKMLQELIVNLQQDNNITICICDHIATSLLQIVDTAMILSNGKIIAQDTPSNLIKDIDAKNAYFGDNFKIN